MRSRGQDCPKSPSALLLAHLARMGQPLFQWAMPDGFPDRASAWQSNLLSRWQFVVAVASDEIDGTRPDWSALESAAGDGSMRQALRNLSALLLGGELPKDTLDALAGTLHPVPQAQVTRMAVGILIASPQYQWR